MKPLLLDLFCGAGGATKGYQRAGFSVHGVDINPQPRYIGDRFIQADALAYVAQYGWMYDAIHASPPCQVHTGLAGLARRHVGKRYDAMHIDLIPQTRFWLKAIGAPYIIENVMGARGVMDNPLVLCGGMFGLKTYRHRCFESNVFFFVPPHPKHIQKCIPKGYVPKSESDFCIVTGKVGANALAQRAMGIDWMSTRRIEDRTSEASQAIPPAYTEYLGRQLMAYVMAQKGQVIEPAPELARLIS